MGIGRFAFTPILPMMQEDLGVTVAQGGWLASANYVGYLLGALSAIRGGMQPRFSVRVGLIVIACATLAMGFEHRFLGWVLLRALAGFGSAWVLVYVSAWALEKLAHSGRADLGGMLYAGVGTGLIFAGLACLVLLQLGASSASAWVVLGLTALLVTAVLWNVVALDGKAATAQFGLDPSPRDIPEFWRLVLCYGAFGLGYIVPATFLPIMAKQVVADPTWFGWAWPVFGAAAALSTLFASRASLVIGQRAVWILGNLVMAAGVLVPIVLPGVVGIVIAAVCVGGTFMVNTMVGMQEARRVAGVHSRMLIAAMTSAFAVGQIAGPLLVSWLVRFEGGFSFALAVAAIPLCLAAYALFVNRGTHQNEQTEQEQNDE